MIQDARARIRNLIRGEDKLLKSEPNQPLTSNFLLKRLVGMEFQMKATLTQLDKIDRHKTSKIVTLERIGARIKKNMQRL